MKLYKIILTIFFAVSILSTFPIYADEPSSWAKNEVQHAIEEYIVPESLQKDYQMPITRAQFAECTLRMCMAYYDESNPSILVQSYATEEKPNFLDLADSTREFSEYAYMLGIIKGRTSTTFDPDAKITRQEAAVMLYRTFMLCGGITVQTTINFSDGNAIADWAQNEVACMAEFGIIHGVGENTFDPLGNYTREQCYLTLVRMLDKMAALQNNNVKKDTIRTNYFVYEIADGQATVVDYIGQAGIVVMQPIIDGNMVTAIASSAFSGQTEVQLCVPDSVTLIEAGAFDPEFKAIYYESEAGSVKSYAEKNGIYTALWDWDTIACIKWARRDDGIERAEPVHGPYYNNDIAYEATTMIYCERSPEDDFIYSVNNGEVTVYDYIGSGMYVSIPETIEGFSVRTLGIESFKETCLNHLEIPKSVRRIEHYSCGIRSQIKTIHLLDGEDCTLGESVFCGENNHVRLHNNIKSITENSADSTTKPKEYSIQYGMTMCIVPVSFESVNNYKLSIYTYNAE